MSKSPDDKIVKLQAHVDAAETLRALIEHPAYSGFFNGYQQSLTAEMCNAAIEDDTARRNAAVKLSVLHAFRSHIAGVAIRGERAAKELIKLEEKNNAVR